MSLRVFHIVFILASIALSVWVGVWGVKHFLAVGGVGMLVMGIFFLLLALALVMYGVKTFEKLKEVR